jgi:RND family efflux transporter MFP subunit
VGASGCGESRAPAERPAEAPVSVRVAAVRLEGVPVTIDAVGTVRARVSTVIASTVQGLVTEVRVREGARVAKGDLLVRIEGAEASAGLARAEAGRQGALHARDEAVQGRAEARSGEAAARAALAEALSARETLERVVEEAIAGRAAAASQATLAQSTLARYRQMYEAKALAPQEYDEVVARERTARGELERADARVAAARAALGQQQGRIAQAGALVDAARIRGQAQESRIEVAAARVREAEAEVARARTQQGYTRILAPGPGLVVERLVEVGELAAPGRPLLRLDDPSGYRLEIALASTEAVRVGMGQAVEVRVDELGGQALAGTVDEIVPAADPATRTVTVKVALPAAVAGLRSGLYGRARFVTGRTESLLVPAAAVLERGQLTALFVVDRERVARLRLVTLGRRHGDRVEVLSGLAAGEEVALDGLDRLVDGSRVTVAS